MSRNGHNTEFVLGDNPRRSYEASALSFARVVRCDYLLSKWDVEIVDSSGDRKDSSFVRGVDSSCLAGMEDTANRRCILAYSPAPKLTQDGGMTMANDTSVGHLILALRWCHQHGTARGGVDGDEDDSVPMALVQCLAERAVMMLGTEIGLHKEAKRAVGDDVVRSVNSELLELFDEFFVPSLIGEYPMSGSGIESLRNRSKRAFQSIVDNEVWDATVDMLSTDLEAARHERKEAQKQWEQGATGAGFGVASPWGGNLRRGGRRSPFRGFGVLGRQVSR